MWEDDDVDVEVVVFWDRYWIRCGCDEVFVDDGFDCECFFVVFVFVGIGI